MLGLRVARRVRLDRVARNDVTKRAFYQGSMSRQEVELPLVVRVKFVNLLKIVNTITMQIPDFVYPKLPLVTYSCESSLYARCSHFSTSLVHIN